MFIGHIKNGRIEAKGPPEMLSGINSFHLIPRAIVLATGVRDLVRRDQNVLVSVAQMVSTIFETTLRNVVLYQSTSTCLLLRMGCQVQGDMTTACQVIMGTSQPRFQ